MDSDQRELSSHNDDGPSDVQLPNGSVTSVEHLGPVALEEVDQQKEDNAVETKTSLKDILRKLSVAGLTDEANISTTPQLTQAARKLKHRRSRSLGEVTFHIPLSVVTAGPAQGSHTKKRSCANLQDKAGAGDQSQGLEQIKQNLLREIKSKLKEQIGTKLECHKSDDNHIDKEQVKPEENKEQQVTDELPLKEEVDDKEASPKVILQVIEEASKHPPAVQANSECGDPNANNTVTVNGTISTPTSPPADDNSKRFSICSLSGAELRKRYSPVYERTRKLVRQGSSVSGSGSINRWSSSQPQAVGAQQQKNGPTSPVTSGENQDTATVLSPVASKSELETDKEGPEPAEKSPEPSKSHSNGTAALSNGNGDSSEPSSQQTVTMDSTTKIGQYSAHPSVYVIEQGDHRSRTIHGSSGIGESCSDKMDKSTSTLKRGSSFRGLRKNLKKTFSTQIPPLTLEKADKFPNTNVPAIVMCCVETLQRKGFLKTEGLYRSSPSQLEVRKVIKHARKGQYDYVKAVEDPVLLAGTIKSFFFNLKQHIISDEAMEKNFPKKVLMGNLSEQEYLERLKGIISDLDTTYYESLEYIIKHLQEVASFSKFNLMTPSNLGVVWAPCLFTNCDKSLNGADLLSFMGEQTRLLELLIVHADALFDRYTLDEIMIAIEDGYPLRDGEPTLNLRPNFDTMFGGPEDFERRKLLRNLSLTFDNVFEACGGNDESILGNGSPAVVRRPYDLQNSATVPAISSAHSDGTVTRQRAQKMKRSRSRAACVVS